jgi:Protein of unknown function (DUF5131)
MSTRTSIEWTEATWNPTTGCDRISAGCDNCYALTLAKRLKAMGSAKYQTDGDPRTSGPGFGVALHDGDLSLPLRWREPRLVFVNSMSDLSGLVTILVSSFPLVKACVPSVFCVQRVSGTEITASGRGQKGRRTYSAAGKRIPESRSMACRKWELDVVALFWGSAVRSDGEVEHELPASSTADCKHAGDEPRLAINGRARPGFADVRTSSSMPGSLVTAPGRRLREHRDGDRVD